MKTETLPTLPGGFLYISAGLIFFVDEEGQLAGALAHEIAHLAARHWASMMTKATILQYAMLSLILGPTPPMSYTVPTAVCNYPNLAIPLASLGVPLAFLKSMREDEAEADYLGLQYLYKASYDPSSYSAFLGKIATEEHRRSCKVTEVFMDRPPTLDRIRKSEDEIKAILPPLGQSLVSTSELDDAKARLLTLVSGMRKLE